mmetsp:Transcript_12760/g.21544  ORF Transcript_12760/g.21544 Transcript_12760/m.21544 type:complete len:225 (+) Transcript_12760:792-1466(+)
MAELSLTKSQDEKPYAEVQMLISERIIQVMGSLFLYNCASDQNELVATEVFLCIDRMAGQGNTHCYMIHCCDKSQTTSFTQIQVRQEPAFNYNLNEDQGLLMWIGETKDEEGSQIPAWAFAINSPEDCSALKGALTKVIYETNMQVEMAKEVEPDEINYLENYVNQAVAEFDELMEGQGEELIDFLVDEDSYHREEQSSSKRHPAQFGFTDEDVNEDEEEAKEE